jgi:putative methionine-R-sulfoxide reductase with GAF domain
MIASAGYGPGPEERLGRHVAAWDQLPEQGPGSHPLLSVLGAARRLASGDGAHLVRWVEGVPQVMAAVGLALPPLRRRPDEGAGRLAGTPAIVTSVTDDVDLVVVRGDGLFDETAAQSLATVARLLNDAAEAPRLAWVALHHVTTKIVSLQVLDDVLLAVANSAAALMHAEIAGILLLDDAGQELQMRCAVGHRAVATSRLRVRRGQGLAGRVLAIGRPQRVRDYLGEPTLSRHFLSIAEEEGTRSALGVPVILHGATVGVLCVWRRRCVPFMDEEESLLKGLADLTALAVHNARSYEEQRATVAALERERADLARRHHKAEQTLQGHEALTRIANDGGNVEAVAAAVRQLTGAHAVLLVGPDCHVEEGNEKVVARLRRRASAWFEAAEPGPARRAELLPPGNDGSCILDVPVRVGDAVFGQLYLGLSGVPGEGEITLAEHAATVCALLWAGEGASASAVRRLQSELLWDLLEGHLPDEAEFLVRRRHLRLLLEFPVRVAIMEVTGLAALAEREDWDPERLERARTHISCWIGGQLEQAGIRGGAQVRRGDVFVAILPCCSVLSPGDVRELGRTLVTHRPRGLCRAVGFSGPAAGLGELPAAYRQAGIALASTWQPEQPVGLFDQLGVLEFLVSPSGGAALARFANRTLGPLLDYDAAHGTSLVETLAAYLAADCTAHRAAQQLFVHPKTMQYRMHRIQELTGLQLAHQEDRFHAQLALKVLSLGLLASPPPQPVGTKASK